MSFTTITFLLFLVLVFGLHWALPTRRLQNALLLATSFVFYSWWDWRFACLMLCTCSIDFAISRGLGRTENPVLRRVLLGLSLTSGLGTLGFFKYFDFFAENLILAAAQLGVQLEPVTLRIVLPVGISFYTFQTMSYTIDVFRRQVRPAVNLIDYLAYVSFFPQLLAGPIERASSLLPQFLNPRKFNYDEARDGLRQILWGVFKKMVLADNLARIVDSGYSDPAAASGGLLILGTVCFAFQIYCDFSAYSDIALGTGRLFNISLMRNFCYPYFSQSVSEFWRRWHISLSTWFRDYLFIPLGGSRGGRGRTAFNILATFTVSGFWHGASWNFILWGLLNGIGMLPSLFLKSSKPSTAGGEGVLPHPVALLKILGTFAFICVTWVFFRARNLSDSVLILSKMGASADGLWLAIMGSPENIQTLIHLGVFIAWEWARRRHPHGLDLPRWHRSGRWALYTLLLFDILYYGTREQGAFIYFQF